MKKTTLILLMATLLSCNDNDLGSDYYYLPKEDALDVGYPYGSMVYQSPEKGAFKSILIYADIVKLESDRRYIYVKQVPNKQLLIDLLRDDIKFWNEYYSETKRDTVVTILEKKMSLKELRVKTANVPQDSAINYMVAHNQAIPKMFVHKVNYYIIDKRSNRIFGPSNFKDFVNEKNRLDVSVEFE